MELDHTSVWCLRGGGGNAKHIDLYLPVEENFVKLRVILELQEATIMGGCTKVISIPRYLEHCVDGMVLEQ